MYERQIENNGFKIFPQFDAFIMEMTEDVIGV
jgi:hypothetical protein